MSWLEDHGYKLVGPLTYMGKEGCQNGMCRSMRQEDGSYKCVGWHCVYCDAPTSYQGHGCDATTAILGASEAILRDEAAGKGSE